jgi:hypothetical protein
MSVKNSNDTIVNRSRDFPVCSAVPQPLHHRVPYQKTGICSNFTEELKTIHYSSIKHNNVILFSNDYMFISQRATIKKLK